jgi:hypothetical protein
VKGWNPIDPQVAGKLLDQVAHQATPEYQDQKLCQHDLCEVRHHRPDTGSHPGHLCRIGLDRILDGSAELIRMKNGKSEN